MKYLKFIRSFFCMLLSGAAAFNIHAQGYGTHEEFGTGAFLWPEGKRMALSLTFDDARLTQADLGIPLLDRYGVKATFYVSPENLIQRVDAWKNAVLAGHDIGNHSLVHPCTGNFSWSRDNALEDYTIMRMNAELDSSNALISTTLGIMPVSFAYPCGQTFVGRGRTTASYVPVIASKFETGRGWLDEAPNDPLFCDLSQLLGMELDGKSFEQIKALIDLSREKGLWLILAGHEINVSGFQTSMLETIEKICSYAADTANGIWIADVHTIASWIREKREESLFPALPSHKNPIYQEEQRLNDLLSVMTLEEKTGQMKLTPVDPGYHLIIFGMELSGNQFLNKQLR